MKKYLLLALIIGLSLSAIAYQYAKADIYGSTLAAWWTFDSNDISGTTVTDKSGNSQTGTTSGSPAKANGILGQALSFSSAQQITTPLTFPSSGSVSMWVNLPNKPFDYIGPWSWNTGGAASVGLEEGSGAGTWTYVFNASGTGENDINGGAIVFNKWTHIVATWSLVSTTWTIKLYINDVLKGTTTHTGTTGSLGTFIIGGFGASEVTGVLDDTRVYNVALSAANVATLYYQGLSQHQNGN